MGVEVTPDDMLRNLEADLEWLINGPVQSVLVAELRACAMAGVRRAIAAEDEADRLRNVCHALEQENRILREDVKGIIDRECDTLLADLADACRERDGLRDQLERRAARASEVVRMCYQTAQKLGIAGTPTILTEAGSVRWILTDLESRHGECAALAQELADVRAERDRLRTLDEGKE